VAGTDSALLELDSRSRFFKLALDLVGLFLRGALLDRLRSRVDEVLRLLEAETGHRAHDLDHLDLLAAGLGEHDVEGGLLLRRPRGARPPPRARAGGGPRHGSGSGDAPLLLDLVLQLDQLEDAHLPKRLEDRINTCHYSSSVLSSVVVSSAAGSSSATGSSSL